MCFDTTSSSSQSAQTTTNVDKRQVVSDSAVGVSSDSSTVNISTLDSGAVNAAISLAASADGQSGENYRNLLELTGGVFKEAFKVIDKNAEMVGHVSGTVSDAYKTANSATTAGDNAKMLAVAGLVVVGLVAIRKAR